MRQKNLVLFDFDGVIADSFAVAVRTAQTLCPHVTEETYRTAFEGNIYDTHHKLLPDSHGPECDHDRDWFEVYIPLFEAQARVFPGMREVITELAHRYILIVVSSSEETPIQGFLEKHHIGRYFSDVMGNEVHKQKTEKIRMIFEKYDTGAEECVFVTDTLGDMREAVQVGVGAIGVTWGWHPRETLRAGEPFRVVDTPKDILPAISDYFARKPARQV